MTGYEIVILIAGIVFIVASFFVGSRGESGSVETEQEIRKIKEAAVFQENEVRMKVQEMLSKAQEEVLAETEDRLDKISNDKIMAVDEFSNQVLSRIENNNQEVVFLYDMLQKKEEEMKSTMNKMEQTRRENRELFDRLEELKQAKARVNSRNAMKKAEGQSTSEKKPVPAAGSTAPAPEPPRAATANQVPQEEQRPKFILDDEPENDSEEAIKSRRQQRVLQLYAEKKSIRDISKELSMGQGEVKLIIDLYANS